LLVHIDIGQQAHLVRLDRQEEVARIRLEPIDHVKRQQQLLESVQLAREVLDCERSHSVQPFRQRWHFLVGHCVSNCDQLERSKQMRARVGIGVERCRLFAQCVQVDRVDERIHTRSQRGH